MHLDFRAKIPLVPLLGVVSLGALGFLGKGAKAVVSKEVKKIRPIQDVREGRAGLKNGTYLYVVMLGDQEHIRLTLGLSKQSERFTHCASGLRTLDRYSGEKYSQRAGLSKVLHIRIHEDHLVHEGVLAGHTSLVQRALPYDFMPWSLCRACSPARLNMRGWVGGGEGWSVRSSN